MKKISDHSHITYKEKCIDALKRNQMRITEPRMIILEILANSNKAYSAQEIYTATSKKVKTRLDRASVYRVLNLLETLGLVHRIAPNGDYIACFHLACEHSWHAIMQCQECQRTEDVVFSEQLSQRFKYELKRLGFFSKSMHLLQIQGICEQCEK